jgi:hypothetical protein
MSFRPFAEMTLEPLHSEMARRAAVSQNSRSSTNHGPVPGEIYRMMAGQNHELVHFFIQRFDSV